MEKQPEKTPNAVEEATTVGMFLKYTRLNQKKTLDTVSKALCIRKIYIKALEESNFKELPPVPYGTGFIRSYAEYLGLNADRIVQCYKSEAMPQKNTDQNRNDKKVIEKHTKLTIPNKKQISIGIIAVVLIYLAWLLLSCSPKKAETAIDEYQPADEEQISDTDSEKPINIDEIITPPEAETETPIEDNQITISDESYAEPPVVEEEPQAASESRVVIKFNGESWFEVRDDQKVYDTGIKPKGYVYNVPDKTGLILSVGRYYNVDVYIDGQLTKVAGPRKQTGIAIDKFLNH